jgi:hypothetical protein
MSSQTIHISPGDSITIVCDGGNTNNNNNDNNNNSNNSNYIYSSNNNNNNSSVGGKRKTRKAQKGGKRAMSGYMKFAKEVRPEILKENPAMKSDVVAVARKIGAKWRAMSDAEKQKY